MREAKIQRRQKRRAFVRDDDPFSVKLGDACTGDHLIKRDTADGDDDGLLLTPPRWSY